MFIYINQIGDLETSQRVLSLAGYSYREKKKDFVMGNSNGRFHILRDKGNRNKMHFDFGKEHITFLPLKSLLKGERERINSFLPVAEARIRIEKCSAEGHIWSPLPAWNKCQRCGYVWNESDLELTNYR